MLGLGLDSVTCGSDAPHHAFALLALLFPRSIEPLA